MHQENTQLHADKIDRLETAFVIRCFQLGK